MKCKSHSKKNRVILAIIVIFINGIYLALDNFPNYDEFTSLAMIAQLAGKDWTPLAQVSDFHGYGHLIILVPIIKFISNGILLYKVCMLWMLILRVLMAEIIYTLCKKLFDTNDIQTLIATLICILGNLSPEHQSPIGVLTEFPLAFISTVAIFFTIKGMNEAKNIYRYIWIVSSTALVGFGYFIHARVIIMVIAYLSSYVILLFLKKISCAKVKWMDIGVCLGSLFAFCLLFKYINGLFVDFLYGGVYLSNSHEVVVNEKFNYLLYELTDIKSIKSAIRIFGAQMASYVFYSFGFIGVIIYINIKNIIRILKDSRIQEEATVLWISLYGMLGWFGMNVAMAFTSVGATLNGGLQWYTYIRYSLPFLLPCVIIAVGIIASKQYIVDKLILVVYAIELIVSKWFVVSIADELDSSGYGLSNTMFNSFFLKSIEETATEYFALFTMIICGIVVILFVVPSKIKCKFLIAIYMSLSIVVYFQVFNWHQDRDEYKSIAIDATVKYLSELANDDVKLYLSGTPKYIQSVQARMINDTFYYIEPEKIESIEENALIFSDVNIETDFETVILDDNEYMYNAKDK